MDNGFVVEAKIKNMKNFIPQCLVWNGYEFYRKNVESMQAVDSGRVSLLEEFVLSKGTGEVFCLEDFFKTAPQQREYRHLNKNVSKLIKKGLIAQVGKERFKVMGNGIDTKN